MIDLRGVPDCIGFSPRTLAALERIESSIEYWCVIENRTLFDKVAEIYDERNAVLWVPGKSTALVEADDRQPAQTVSCSSAYRV